MVYEAPPSIWNPAAAFRAPSSGFDPGAVTGMSGSDWARLVGRSVLEGASVGVPGGAARSALIKAPSGQFRMTIPNYISQFGRPTLGRTSRVAAGTAGLLGAGALLGGDADLQGRDLMRDARGRTAAELAAIRGYLSGQTGRPRRPGDFSYVGDGRADGGAVDWESILAALEGQRSSGGGVGVDRSLFQLSETPEEAAMLASEMADIEARRAAGDIALREGWGKVRSANAAAADKARLMSVQAGEGAAASWSQAAQQARDLAAQRAEAAGQFEGRAGVDVDPEGGAADFIGFMESQAPAERRFAERQQEILGSDLDWMAGMAGSQGEAYAGDLRRQANVLSFERAREHNLRVQERTSGERMMLAQMEMQAQATNAQLAAQAGQFDPFAQLNNMVGAAAVMGNPGLLAQQLGITPAQAQQMINNFLRGTQATVQAATPVR